MFSSFRLDFSVDHEEEEEEELGLRKLNGIHQLTPLSRDVRNLISTSRKS
jgi:hypothetical protein